MNESFSQLAAILVDHAGQVQKGENVLIDISDFSNISLAQEVYRLCLQRGANVEIDVCGMSRQNMRADTGGFSQIFFEEASKEQLQTAPKILEDKVEWADVILRVLTVHDPLFLSGADVGNISIWNETLTPVLEKMISHKRWVLTKLPTQGIADLAGMDLNNLLQMYIDGCLVDYSAMGARIQKLQDILDAGSHVHITGEAVDLCLAIEGRLAAGADTGRRNIPDGECFLGPVEDQTSGYITYEERQIHDGSVVEGLKLMFEEGKIVDWSCAAGEEYFAAILDAHKDNGRFGELGIGMNPSITKYSGMTLLDEKIMGTVHMAIGKSYSSKRGGGQNGGTVHWDLVKDLRHTGSSVMVDDIEIMKDGEVLI